MSSVIENLKEKLNKYPDVPYTFDETSISFPASIGGFGIMLETHEGGATVNFGVWHEEFEDENEAIDVVGFGLSEMCRLRILSRGQSDYKWIVEEKEDTGWEQKGEVGLLFWPFWRKKTERILQNHYIKAV